MRAVVRDAYGSPEVLRLEQIDRPTPGRGEVLVRVRASSLNRADRYVLQGIPAPIRLMTGLVRPTKRGLGMDFAGEVVELGAGVAEPEPGDAVYGQQDFGQAWAEYAVVPAEVAAPMPAGLSWEQAAAIPVAGITALQGLRDAARLQAGQRVLINGATGSVGPLSVQIARAMGAHVTAVCSGRNVELVRSLGAHAVIAYETEDYPECGERFDVLFDIVGDRSIAARRRVVEPKGTIVLVGAPDTGRLGPAGALLAGVIQGVFASQRVAAFTAAPNQADLRALTALIEAGKLAPAIDRSFELGEIVDAMHYLQREHPPSKVVLTVAAAD